MLKTKTRAKPFLKWAGGKSRLLEQYENYFPEELENGCIRKYIEPFVGGGAVFFHMAQTYRIKEFSLFDINEELILSFRVVQNDVEDLIAELMKLEKCYLAKSQAKRQSHYYRVRDKYNEQKASVDFSRYSGDWIPRAAQMLFLNKTCFNGLFRVNKSGGFNVPLGRYDNPGICDEDNLRNASELLENATIECVDFGDVVHEAAEDTFVYYDPPYRPISSTSNFTSYSRYDFHDEQQRRLASVFRKVHGKGAMQMLSNSDPSNKDPDDYFFDELYHGFSINRVRASRMINSMPARRGQIFELVITNY